MTASAAPISADMGSWASPTGSRRSVDKCGSRAPTAAARSCQPACRCRPPGRRRRLRRELDGHHVAVAHHVVAPLEAKRAAIAGARVAALRHELVPRHDLSAYESALDVGVDLA